MTSGKNDRKYIFFDIDNTLAVGTPGKQYVPQSAAEAIDELRSKGHFTAIATGRAHAMAESYRKQLGFENMVSDGGNGITIDGRLRELHPLPYEKCLRVIDECEEKGIAWAVQTDDSDTRLAPDGRFLSETHDVYMKTRTVPGLDVTQYQNIYKMYIAGRYPIENTIVSVSEVPHCRYHETYFFVEPTDKARGIREMVDILGGNPEDVIVFGDGENDLSMFDGEWTCVAMGNAVPELKAKADFVTKDAADDGIYYACRELGLI
ncbi:MAG: HAD hydrolase family protein [Anaerovoracaceae bacterium]